ncbi:hypothetical protein J4220_03810 [Candidatus Micrarchaeota archaeon]|nr:hypothetical protein [Candidatus Micrarchaeota archaeon]
MKKRTARKSVGKKSAITIRIRLPNEKRLHNFMDAWKRHIHEEIRIHKQLLEGKHGFDRHLDETIAIHAKFLKELQKI